MSQELTTERLLSLRAVPIFGILPITDLQVIARYTNDREFRAGASLQKANEIVDRIHILTHGQVEIRGPGESIRVQDAPFAVGVFPVLAAARGRLRDDRRDARARRGARWSPAR